MATASILYLKQLCRNVNKNYMEIFCSNHFDVSLLRHGDCSGNILNTTKAPIRFTYN